LKFSLRLLALFLSISSLIYQKEVKALTVTIQQSGADVLFSFDGSIDLTGATFTDLNGNGFPTNFTIRSRFQSASSSPFIEFSGKDGTNTSAGWRWEFNPNSIRVPAFGTNSSPLWAGDGFTVIGSGDLFRMSANTVSLPQDYSSGDIISGDMRFANTTIAGLDITPGNYSYALGNNNMEIVAMPAPLPILGLPVVFSYFKKLKEKSRLHRGAKGAAIGASNSKL